MSLPGAFTAAASSPSRAYWLPRATHCALTATDSMWIAINRCVTYSARHTVSTLKSASTK